MEDNTNWATVRELAETYKVSRPTIKRWALQCGALNQIGPKTIRIDKDKFLAYIKKRASLTQSQES